MAAREALKVGKELWSAVQNEKPRTSVSALIDILTLEKYEEDDYEGITELVESINVQPQSGPTEASRAIRKKLKYSNIHGQLRSLTILKALVENCGTKFQTTFANERLVDRIKVMAGDPHTDPHVKKKIMSVLGSWHRQFKDDPRMQLVAGLYVACGGGRKTPSKTAATEAYEKQRAQHEREAAERADRKMAERLAREQQIEAEKRAKQQKKLKPGQKPKRIFNFEQEKPRIMSSVAQGTQAAQGLINALQLVNREKESVTENARVQECLAKAKADRKQIVRYIQFVDSDPSGDYIGSLLATNEQILSAMALYDRYSKPIEYDSDEEAVQADQAQSAVPPAKDDDVTSIRSKLSAFDVGGDREIEKLQFSQRRRVERVNSYRAQLHPDLQDLAFGPTAGSSSLPPPIQPRSAEDSYQRGSLSDFSDGYSSSDGEEYAGGAPPTSSSSSHGNALPDSNARSYAQFVQAEDERTGKGKGLLEETGEDDPFADPFADEGGEPATPGVEYKRMEWKEI